MANFDEKCKAIALRLGKNEAFQKWPILMKNARL